MVERIRDGQAVAVERLAAQTTGGERLAIGRHESCTEVRRLVERDWRQRDAPRRRHRDRHAMWSVTGYRDEQALPARRIWRDAKVTGAIDCAGDEIAWRSDQRDGALRDGRTIRSAHVSTERRRIGRLRHHEKDEAQRSDRHGRTNCLTSFTNTSGSSQAAKWPPCGCSVQCTTL